MDQTRDINGREFYRITRLYQTPEFVKSASIETLCGDDNLAPEAYGDPRFRLYPCHNTAATWTSAAFFFEKKSSMKETDADMIHKRIKHAASIHGITKTIENLEKKVASINRYPGEDELLDEEFALTVDMPDGSKARHYPLRNNNEIKKAAEYFVSYRDKFPFEMRYQFAEKILQKMAEYGVRLSDEQEYILEKHAGRGICTANECAEFLLNRVHSSRKGAGKLNDVQRELLKLAHIIAKKPSYIRTNGALYKTACVVDQFDKLYGLNKYYGDGIQRIEDVLFSLTREKMASVAKDYCATITGNIYKFADIERLKLNDIENILGSDYREAFTSNGLDVDSEKAAAVIPTLPRPDAELFDQLMNDIGIKPTAKEASSQAIKISNEYLLELSREYKESLK